jgi:hypothetical protein
MIMSAIALAILAGVMTWAATSNKLTHRSIQYTRSVAAAEAATEKVESQMTRDFLNGGELTVSNNLNSYRQTVPTTSDSSYWNTWVFDDGNGNANQTYVQLTSTTNTIALDAPYTGLKGYGSTYAIASHASDTASPQDVNAGVVQQLQLVRIPVFQFAMFSSGNMEISCGHPFDITGHVHCNGILYIEPDNSLKFESGVTAVLNVLNQRDSADGDTRGTPAGLPAVYVDTNSPTFPVNALTLPIGTTNTPEAIREIIEPPPAGGDTNAALAALRYYNICDLRLTVSDNGVVATAGTLVHLMRQITTNELSTFVSVSNSFWDQREGKTVLPIDINIGNLTTWIGTNTSLPGLSSIYILDNRTPQAGFLGAVRVYNGTNLPPNGLTVATGLPLYVWGDYNDDPSKFGTADTSMTHPASLVADAITFLSDAWQDNNSTDNRSDTGEGPPAANTTVNAALLTGVVETAPQTPPPPGYSGGMENFPRFLENWGSGNTNTYNGSMVKMFPSLYATNPWGKQNVYEPPARNWAYDSNFDDPTKLPPKTPSFLQVKRHQWATVPAGTNTVAATP